MPSTFPYLFWILGLSPVSYDFTPGGYPDTPARVARASRACRVSLSAVGTCILGPMGFMGSNSRITGTRTHESEIKGTDFHGQWPTSNGLSLCVFFTLTRSRYSFSWVSSITLAPMTYAFHQGILPVPCWHAFTQPPPLGKPGQTSLSIECTPRRPVSSPSPAMEASDVFGDFFDQNWPPFTMEPAAIASVKSEMFHVPFSASRKPLIVVFLHI